MTQVSENAITAAVANDSRFIDNYIEFCLNSPDYRIALAAEDDLALAIALHECDRNVFNEMEVSKIAWQKKIENIWVTVQLFKQSSYYLDLFNEHEEAISSKLLAISKAEESEKPIVIANPPKKANSQQLTANSPTKASKRTPKQAIAFEIPSDLSWDVVKGMKYRELQQLGKALRSQGIFQGNVAGKGINTEYLRSAIAQALGFNVVHANFTPEVAEVA